MSTSQIEVYVLGVLRRNLALNLDEQFSQLQSGRKSALDHAVSFGALIPCIIAYLYTYDTLRSRLISGKFNPGSAQIFWSSYLQTNRQTQRSFSTSTGKINK